MVRPERALGLGLTRAVMGNRFDEREARARPLGLSAVLREIDRLLEKELGDFYLSAPYKTPLGRIRALCSSADFEAWVVDFYRKDAGLHVATYTGPNGLGMSKSDADEFIQEWIDETYEH